MGHGGLYGQCLYLFGLDDLPNWYTVGSRACDVSLAKVRDGEIEYEPSIRKERENIIVKMLKSKENWLTVFSAAVEIQNKLLELRRTKA